MLIPNFSRDILDAVRRSEMPGVLFPADAAVHLGLTVDETREAMRDGLLGPWFSVHGEPAVLRESFREHLRLLTTQINEADREVIADEPEGRL